MLVAIFLALFVVVAALYFFYSLCFIEPLWCKSAQLKVSNVKKSCALFCLIKAENSRPFSLP